MASKTAIKEGEELGVEPRTSGERTITTDKKSGFGSMERVTSNDIGME
jgi:hypothetical protein